VFALVRLGLRLIVSDIFKFVGPKRWKLGISFGLYGGWDSHSQRTASGVEFEHELFGGSVLS
jgi:hypothetical protein